MMAGRPGQDAAQQAQAMILPPPCFTDGDDSYAGMQCVLFSRHNSFSFKPIRSVLVSSIHCTFLRSPSGLSTWSLASNCIFGEQWLSAVCDLLMLGSLTLSLANVRKAFRCLVRSYSGNLFNLRLYYMFCFGVIFVGRALLGKVTVVICTQSVWLWICGV